MIVTRLRRGNVARSVAYLTWSGYPPAFVGQARMQNGVWCGPVVAGPVPIWWPCAYNDPLVEDAIAVIKLLEYNRRLWSMWDPLVD